LIDEDTSATNFMIRDKRMQLLVSKDKEPITPFIYKVRSLLKDYSVSCVLVIGGSGDYFDVADTVVAMNSYSPQDVTTTAKQIAAQHPTGLANEGGQEFGKISHRSPTVLLPSHDRHPKVAAPELNKLRIGHLGTYNNTVFCDNFI
jgi:predicted ABC-class ATPase